MNPAADFIRKKFREYYQKKGIVPPSDFEKREFGFGNDKKIDYRHHGFKTADELKGYFITNTPLYASFSSAYYEFPSTQPMNRKNLLGSDLIFEFDAECSHDKIACVECLEKAKQDTIKLIEDFLIPDFGFKKSDIAMTFSGSRGYHVYIVNDEVKHLGGEARRQIVDYLQAKNLDIKSIIRGGATLGSKGWRGRLARAAREHAEKSSEKKFTEKEDILKKMSEGNYDLFRGAHSFWDKLLNEQIVHLSSGIDQSVTIDISRLIRMPSTLHGGSSLLCMRVDSLDKFNPFNDAVVFYNPPMKIKMLKDVGEFVLKEQTFEPLVHGQEANLPEYAALYLICKEAAIPLGL